MSGSDFTPIGDGDEQRFGPRAFLLSGFSEDEAKTVSDLLERLGIADARVLLCSKEMLTQTVGEILEGEPAGEPAPADKLPRIFFLSGITGKELHAILGEFASTGLTRPVFGAATPNNVEFTVRDLLVQLYSEHRMMMKMRQQEG